MALIKVQGQGHWYMTFLFLTYQIMMGRLAGIRLATAQWVFRQWVSIFLGSRGVFLFSSVFFGT